jgi:phosphoadenosine phosphosulfate reductase
MAVVLRDNFYELIEWAAAQSAMLETLDAQQRVYWAFGLSGLRSVLSSGFGPQSGVTLGMAPDGAKVIDVDTQHRYQETEDYKRLLIGRFPHLDFRTYRAPETRTQQLKRYGDPVTFEKDSLQLKAHFERNKQEPMARALAELDADLWISGRRRAHNDNRAKLPVFEYSGGIFRLYPIVDWSNRQVHEYMKAKGLPEHPFGAMGYSRVGEYFELLNVDKGECGLFEPAGA